MIRDITKADWPEILRLNEESVHFLSAMDEAKLAKWSAAASYFRVVELDGKVAAFLMGFRKGDDYAGVNFAWFAQRYSDFVYVDRIVVAPDYRGRKLADVLAGLGHVAEGVKTTRSAHDLARKLGVDMPITHEVYRVLYDEKPPRQAVQDLMTRELRSEF